jgi:hypothetical protein
MRFHWGFICEKCNAVELRSKKLSYHKEKPVLEPPACPKCKHNMQEADVVEVSNRPRLIYLGIVFSAGLVSALISLLFYTIFKPAGTAEMGPLLGSLFVLLLLPAWWAALMLLVYFIIIVNSSWSWLSRRPVLQSPPPWFQIPTRREEVMREAKLSLWFLAVALALGLLVSLFKSIVGSP